MDLKPDAEPGLGPKPGRGPTANLGPKPEFGPANGLRERRACPRQKVNAEAVLHLIRSGQCLPGCLLDLSRAGCRIRCRQPFALGIYTRLEIEFLLEGQPLRLVGVVEWVQDPGKREIGIRFLDLSERKRQLIEDLTEDMGAGSPSPIK